MDIVYIVRYVYNKAIIALFYDFYDALEYAEWEVHTSCEEIEILTKKVW